MRSIWAAMRCGGKSAPLDPATYFSACSAVSVCNTRVAVGYRTQRPDSDAGLTGNVVTRWGLFS
jgi:hypothetical protein